MVIHINSVIKASKQKLKWTSLSLLVFTFMFQLDINLLGGKFAFLSSIYTLGKLLAIIAVIWIILESFVSRKSAGINLYTSMCLILILSILLSTVLHNQDIYTYVLSPWLPILCCIFFVELTIKQNKLDTALSALRLVLTILLILNFVFIITHARNYLVYLSHSTLLGHKNSVRNYVLLDILVSLILDYYQGKRISAYTWFIAVISILMQFIAYSATGLIVTLLMMLFCIMALHGKHYSVIWLSLIFLVLNIIVVLGTSTFLKYFVENILHKDITFTGRRVIWETALQLIHGNTLLGRGAGDLGLTYNIGSFANTAHNAILHIMYIGGLLSLTVSALLIFVALKPLSSKKRSYIASIISACYFSFMISGIFEHLINPQIFIVLLLAYNTPEIIEWKIERFANCG